MNSSNFMGSQKFKNRLLKMFKNKKFNKVLLITLIIGIITGGGLRLGYNQMHKHQRDTLAYNVSFGNKDIGIVRNKEMVTSIVKSIEEELSNDYNIEVVINQSFKFEKVHAEENELTELIKIENNIKSKLTYNVVAYGIEVKGNTLGLLKTKKLANKLLEEIKKPYIEMANEKGAKLEEVEVVEDVNIVKREVPFSKVQKYDEVLKYIRKGTTEEKTHVVKKGESFWSIAHKYNITVEDLIKANIDKDSEVIQPGDEISLVVAKPFLTVATYEEKKYIEKVPYETKYEKTASLYNDEVKVKRSGTPGKKEVVAKVEKQNGIEVAKEILKQTLISQPVAQIKIKGTKEPPPTKGTGRFMRPTSGRLTSRYGPRGSRFHYGVDLASEIGTPIKAADGGVVTFAGWKGGYGYMVEIDHGGGFKTRYAHCSKIYVKKGQRVYKDKTISAVGNTGRSKGPHVHFEVLKYDKNKNPYSYIGKKYR
ncbi:MAG: M23 family metallopeptidase [Firmicutes bacterium]|nr:M23 family metallopeptidase [Bacillota bacterium]